MSPVPSPNWTHPASLIRVIDGDTAVFRVDLGRYPMKVEITATIRIAGLFSPERSEKGGPEATDALASLLTGPVVLQTRKPDPRDPYGRVVADVFVDGKNVAEAMIAAGHGTATK